MCWGKLFDLWLLRGGSGLLSMTDGASDADTEDKEMCVSRMPVAFNSIPHKT